MQPLISVVSVLIQMQPSLQAKLTFGYLVVALLAIGVSLYTFEAIHVVEQRILMGERVSSLLDAAMEVRRFERNYFLHGQDADRLENERYQQVLQNLLTRNKPDFVLLGVSGRVASLSRDLEVYGRLMNSYAKPGADRPRLEPQIRRVGQDIVAIAETAASAERQLVRNFLARLRITLVVTIVGLALLMIAVGQALSRRVMRPLKQLEVSVGAAKRGQRDHLPMPSRDREMVAIIDAFNQMLKELEQRQKHLMRSEKLASLGTMLSGVAHELNNPLSNIWSSGQILLEELETSDLARQKKLVGQINEQSMRARNIVRTLLDFARDRRFVLEMIGIREVVEQTIQFLRGELPAGVRVVLDIGPEIALQADRQRLQQVLLNLIKNAVEAVGDTGEVTVAARFMAEATNTAPFPDSCPVSGPAVDIEIRDSGPGISAETLPRIFDPFFTTRAVGHGMGLGLFIVHQIIEEHGGCIVAVSNPGEGARFHIRLPAKSA
jgi:two-component system NtrC family sensor kinase